MNLDAKASDQENIALRFDLSKRPIVQTNFSLLTRPNAMI